MGGVDCSFNSSPLIALLAALFLFFECTNRPVELFGNS